VGAVPVRRHGQVELPNDPNYHFMTDMTEKARAWIKYQKAMTPDKPFFVYFAPGATTRRTTCRRRGSTLEGQVRPGLGQDPRGDAGAADRAGRRARRHQAGAEAAGDQGLGQLSADEKRLFARQAEVFAAFVEYTDHEIGRMLEAFEEVGQADNTLVFYIAGDNGTSGEGGQNGMFNEYTYFNGVQEKVEDMLKLIDKWGGPETYPHMAAGWAVAFNAPFGWMKQVPSDFGGTRNGMAVLAQGHQGEERHPHPVRPRDRRRADGAGGDRPARAEERQRRAADSRWTAPASLCRSTTPKAPRNATRRSISRSRATARSTTTAGCAHHPQGALGGPSRAAAEGQLGLGALRRAIGLQPGQRPRGAEPEEARRDAGAVPEGGRQVRRAADGRPRLRAAGPAAVGRPT
jgi:hypothetical protein